MRPNAMSEYRVWITVPNLPFSRSPEWEPFIKNLETRYDELGPVLSWEGDKALVIASLETDGEASAAQRVVDAVAEALRGTGLGDRYPDAVQVERIDEREPLPA
jgi:hypothetical protein